jgi:hypothetical protein
MAIQRLIFFSLLPAIVLTLPPVKPATAETGARELDLKPHRELLVSREKALRRSDAHGAVNAELRVVRRWLVLAKWAGSEGAVKQERRMLQLAELQLVLARRLLALSRMRAEVDRLKRALARTKKAIIDDRDRNKQRGEYLEVLRSTR